MPHPLSHKYPIPISQLCLVNTDVPAGVGAPPLNTTRYLPMALLHSAWLYNTLPSLYLTDITLQWLYFALIDSTLLYHGSSYITLLYSTILHHGFTSLYFTLHNSTMALFNCT